MTKRRDEPTGITCEEGDGWKRWTGTREELLKAGICASRHFPEGRKRSAYPGPDSEERWNTERCAGGRYKHWRRIELTGEAAARAQAMKHGEWAIAMLLRAVNYLGETESGYRYSEPDRRRCLDIAKALATLVKEGKIVLSSNAEHDSGFQKFMARLGFKADSAA